MNEHKYGVLRVQPQPETSRYYHRNGETELPTVSGWYWFCGELVGVAGQWYMGDQIPVYDESFDCMVTKSERRGIVEMPPGYRRGSAEYRGKWYGPIIAPW
jgi:hypothetical protein